jgi:two-component system phosphate regulon sensor histidine kinase PhoR
MKNYSVRVLSFRIILIFILISSIYCISNYFTNLYIAITIFAVLIFISYFIIRQLIYKLFVNKISKIIRTAESVEETGEQPEPYLSDVENKAFEIIKSHRNEIKLLKSKEKFRKNFLGNISHELKTPIFSIQGYILTLIDGGLNDKNINLKYLNLAERNINRLIEIIEDLDKITKLETGEIDLKPTKFNITELISGIIESLEYKGKKKKISLKLKTTDNFYVFADKYQITTLLSNLIRNSINYGNQNGQTEITITEKNNLIYISIKDNGIGIPEKDIDKIFERFYRVDKSRSRDLGGSGLGLSIVKHIIEAHKQKIEVKSKIDYGSEFIFTLEKAK